MKSSRFGGLDKSLGVSFDAEFGFKGPRPLRAIKYEQILYFEKYKKVDSLFLK